MAKYDKDPQWKRGKDDTGERRLAWHQALVRESMVRGDCWIISTPSASEVLLECLPTSTWPDELRGRGFPLIAKPGGQRILPHAIKTEMVLTSSGAMTPATPGSTMPTTAIVTAAGIVETQRFKFRAPF
jgi:hypothetical protein